MKVSHSENIRILLTRTDRIGDLVMSTPVFEAIKKYYPQSYLAVCVFSEHRELVEGNPFVDEVILYEKQGSQKNFWGQGVFANQIRAKKFDIVLHLHATNRMHGMSWLAGIPRRVGYNRRAAWTLTDVRPYDKKDGLKSETEYLLSLCASVFPKLADHETDLKEMFPHVPVTDRNKLSLVNLLEHCGVAAQSSLAVIHPAASDDSKMWPAQKFSELLEEAPGKNVCWIAVGDSRACEQAEKIAQQSKVPLLNLCEKLSLGMLAALFEKAKWVISNDSGPAHIAAAVGAPTVSIFGRWQPGLNAERWRPSGPNATFVAPDIEDIAVSDRAFSYIQRVSVEQVLEAMEKVSA